MELISDIRSELGDDPSSHVSKAGTVDVKWGVPQPAAFPLASRIDFLSFPQVFGDQHWHVWQGFEVSTCIWHVPAAYRAHVRCSSKDGKA